ncbi:condensation domain-containing protein [Streptomyces sp. NPDC048611]|uniref:condensation domain-containing protein n=1 Tax=Streptomyces sp. NPDC048611 TaxID=3155635 RepID=UPI00344560DE
MGARFPLSASQTSVWVAQQLDPGDRSFNIGEYCEIRGAVDPERFEDAVREVVSETDALRSRFEMGSAGLNQVVEDSVEWSMRHFDVSRESDPHAAARRWMTEDLETEFDIQKGPVFSSALFRAGPELFFWYRSVHHVAVDGFALSLITAQVADVYTELITGRPRQPGAPAPLEAVITDDTEYQASAAYEDDRHFWLERLDGLTSVPSLVAWRPAATRESIRLSRRLTAPEVDSLRALGRRLGTTWPEVVIAAVAVYLHRATGSRDVLLGLPVTARTKALLRRIPSMLTNSVPLRLRMDPSTPLGSVLTDVAEELESARERQRYPRERLIRELGDFPEGRRQFGVDVNIMAFNYSFDYAGCPSLTRNLKAGPVDDLTVNVYDRLDGEGLLIEFDGNAELYSPELLREHLSRFTALIGSWSEQVADAPVGSLGDEPL